MGHRREVYVERRLIPQVVGFLVLKPAKTVVGNLEVKVVDNLGENETHLGICQTIAKVLVISIFEQLTARRGRQKPETAKNYCSGLLTFVQYSSAAQR